jgi:thioredoxin 1/putative thioredoxin
MPVTKVTENTFERDVLRSELPVLLEFTAAWCQPCKVQGPILAEVARELEGQLKVVQVDVDQSPRLAAMFRVQSVPQLFVLEGGEVVTRWDRGVADKKTILRLVQPVLPRGQNEIKPQELAALIQQRRAVAVDVRDRASFARYHIPGAINIPADDVPNRTSELRPRDGRLRVLYARTSEGARELAESLAKQGVQVGWLDGGFLHWEAEGLEVERGTPR